jgi:hypothetical protein
MHAKRTCRILLLHENCRSYKQMCICLVAASGLLPNLKKIIQWAFVSRKPWSWTEGHNVKCEVIYIKFNAIGRKLLFYWSEKMLMPRNLQIRTQAIWMVFSASTAFSNWHYVTQYYLWTTKLQIRIHSYKFHFRLWFPPLIFLRRRSRHIGYLRPYSNLVV